MLQSHNQSKTGAFLRYAAVIAVFVVTVLLFPSSKETLVFLHQADYNMLSHAGETGADADLRTPGGGEYVLPPEVQIMIGLLRSYRVGTFRFSPEIADKPVFAQRLTEGAYPLQVSAASPFLVFFVGEQIPGACRIIASQEGVALAYCP